jgi:hypothetical protein
VVLKHRDNFISLILVPVPKDHAMEAHRGHEGKAPLILKLDTVYFLMMWNLYKHRHNFSFYFNIYIPPPPPSTDAVFRPFPKGAVTKFWMCRILRISVIGVTTLCNFGTVGAVWVTPSAVKVHGKGSRFEQLTIS